MNHNFIYVGCFINYHDLQKKVNSIRKVSLSRQIRNPHITFAYKPESVDESLFGKKIKIIITGYGYNEDNEGVKVELYSNDSEIVKMIKNIPVPHITLSVITNGKPVNTRNLIFNAVEPIEIEGIYVGYASSGDVITFASE